MSLTIASIWGVFGIARPSPQDVQPSPSLDTIARLTDRSHWRTVFERLARENGLGSRPSALDAEAPDRNIQRTLSLGPYRPFGEKASSTG